MLTKRKITSFCSGSAGPLTGPVFGVILMLRTVPPDREHCVCCCRDLYSDCVLYVPPRQIVDREVVHSEAEARRNTRIRDVMREQCVPQLVDTWLATLSTYPASQPQLACMCLEAVGKYVSWIDIGLVRRRVWAAEGGYVGFVSQ